MYTIYKIAQINKIAEDLITGKIGILPTDTIYGIHCITGDKNLIQKIYEIKERPEGTPFITLIQTIEDIEKFGVVITTGIENIAKNYWPGANTLIFDAEDGISKSFRLPKNDFLIELLKLTGPLISTSANTHGNPSAKNIEEAIKYFGEKVDFYVDFGTLDNPPSNIYKFTGDKVEKIR